MASPRLFRPLAAGAAVALVVPAAIAFAPASSAATVKTDTGDANSTATVLSLTALGHTVKAVVTSLDASTITSPKSAVIDVVPVNLDGTNYGEQKITNGSKSLATVSKSVAGAVGVSTPSLNLQASPNGPIARLTSAGGIAPSLLGISLARVSSNLTFGSSVLSKTSDASKAVHVTGFSLPSLKDLLGKLGLDITQLPTSTLQKVVNKLNLATTAITNAENAAAAIPAATANVVAKTTALTTALNAAPFANAGIQTLLAALSTPLSGTPTAAEWQAISASDQNTITDALDVLSSGTGAAIKAANTALTTAEQALAALQALAGTLTGLLVGALDTPLLSIGDVTIGTVADAGAKHVAQVTGSIKGVTVLGNQLIKSTDVVNLASSVLATVQTKINTLTAALSSALSGSALNGLLGTLTVPAPKISLLQKSTSLSPNGGYQAAAASVVGAAVSWGALSIPTVAIPGVVGRSTAKPNAGVVNGQLITDPIAVSVADLSEGSRYAPAAATTTPTGTTPGSTSSTPGLATTGVSAGLAVGALILMLAAYGVRRIRAATVTSE